MVVPQMAPGQQVPVELPPQTPSPGVSMHVSERAAQMPAAQSSPAQQSVAVMQAFPIAAQDNARQAKVMPSVEDTHSLP